MTQRIFTRDEFVYDVLNNLVHRRIITLPKSEINFSFNRILKYMHPNITITDNGDSITIIKPDNYHFNVFFKK